MPAILVCGAINWDTTLFVEILPQPGQEIKVDRVISVPGGKGANTAVAASRILGRDQVAMVGCLGADKIALEQIRLLRDEGIDTEAVVRHSDLPSGQAYVLVDKKGENMILTHRAANNELTLERLRNENVIISVIEKSDTMVIIDPPLDTAMELARQARVHGKSIIVSPATLAYRGIFTIKELLMQADYVILNEHEANRLSSKDSGTESCEWISDHLGGKPTLTTLGKKGCILCHGGQRYPLPSMDLAEFGLAVKSTVGAGDTFVGAFASFKAKGKDDLESAFLANVAAALKTTKEETRGSPAFEEIRVHAESEVMRPAYDTVRGYRKPSRTL